MEAGSYPVGLTASPKKRFMRIEFVSVIGILALTATAPVAFGDAVVFSATGTDAEITAVLNQFRDALGPLNANVPGSFGTGRREINWDGVPDSASAPNAFPGDFFNVNVAGRARGAVFVTFGDGFQVSADSDNPTGTPINFANVNPQYGSLFRAFSPPRLFTPVGNNVFAVDFFVPGTNMPATVSGFGAVFSDVDALGSTVLLFISETSPLTTVFAPVATTPSGGASFIGVLFDAGERVSAIEIASGNVRIGPGQNEGPLSGGGFADAVVMDDFVYGEPVRAPSRCPGDVNGNNAVELSDLTQLLASFGACVGGAGFNPAAELNGDGCVALEDLTILLANFGTTCP